MPAVMFLKAPARLERRMMTSAESGSGHRRAENNTEAVGGVGTRLRVWTPSRTFGVIICRRSPQRTITLVAPPLVRVLERVFLPPPLPPPPLFSRSWQKLGRDRPSRVNDANIRLSGPF